VKELWGFCFGLLLLAFRTFGLLAFGVGKFWKGKGLLKQKGLLKVK
jgi:hypothetical protein